jgi:hypothetical protein
MTFKIHDRVRILRRSRAIQPKSEFGTIESICKSRVAANVVRDGCKSASTFLFSELESLTTPVLFLDYHGVLEPMRADCHGPCEQCIVSFNRIIAETRAAIVLSANWRASLKPLLASHGINGRVIGQTREEVGDDEPRWMQIRDWLKENIGQWGRYCILDDDPDAFGGRPGVLVNGAVGLTEADANEAIAILNRATASVRAEVEAQQ